MTTWASTADVKALTGVTVTDEQRAQAVATLELHIGLIEAVERTGISERDRYWLKLATAYQAAWAVAQPDLFERNDVATAGADGQSATFRPDAHTLAPLARKAIKRLSWRGPRTLITSRVGVGIRNVNSDEYEDTLPWRPM